MVQGKIPLLALPWCCVIPIGLSFLGVGSAALAGFLRRFTPLFLIISIGLIGWSNYRVHFGHKGSKRGKIWVTLTSLLSISLWIWSLNNLGFI